MRSPPGVAVRLLTMGGKTRALWPVVAAVAIVMGTFGLVYAVWRSPHRNDLATFGSYAAAVTVAAVALITRTWKTRAKLADDAIGTQELNRLADLLAGAVNEQWTQAATDRGLLQSEPIPVRWHRLSLPFAGPVAAAVDSQRFQPLPGLSAV